MLALVIIVIIRGRRLDDGGFDTYEGMAVWWWLIGGVKREIWFEEICIWSVKMCLYWVLVKRF